MNHAPKIVLTGGPCGGKTTLMRELRTEDPECRKWVLVPEAAPLLFQAAVVRVQMALEEAHPVLQMWLDNRRN